MIKPSQTNIDVDYEITYRSDICPEQKLFFAVIKQTNLDLNYFIRCKAKRAALAIMTQIRDKGFRNICDGAKLDYGRVQGYFEKNYAKFMEDSNVDTNK